jgi:NADPH:quinone reductase
MAINQGDDIAGLVAQVGSRVYEFSPGDRVGAFHRMFQPAGSYAEYAIAPSSTTFRLPPNISFEAAATLPLASMTAALALYQQLRNPLPWLPATGAQSLPILIYGGASAVGSFALKLAKLSNLSPIITVAGSGIDHIKSLGIADYIVDYRGSGVAQEIKAILEKHGIQLMQALDCVAKDGTWNHILEVLGDGGRINMVDPPDPPVQSWPRGISYSRVFVSTAYGVPYDNNRSAREAAGDKDFAQAFYR